ncbi:MAG TPA: TolC family protein [Gemmataceae bacterium]|nr:TolC family protein [Gemmataceae bacterium]
MALLLTCAGCVDNHSFAPVPLPPFLFGDYETKPLAPLKDSDTKAKLPPSGKATLLPPTELPDPHKLTLDAVIKEALQSDPKIRAAAENISQASADLWTASLAPNPVMTTSGTLLPLTRPFTVDAQGGPPQFDVGFSFPTAWLLFGQRQAAMDNARVGVNVAAADFTDLVRQRIADTVAAYYDVLEAKALLDLAREDQETQKRLDGITKDRVKIGGVGAIEVDRIRLAVLDADREVRKREAVLVTARTALQAQLGRLEIDPQFDVDGSLDVAAAPPAPPQLQQAITIADQYRPDIVSLRLQIAKSEFGLKQEQTKAYPEVTPHLGYTRQFQERAIGFPDASSYGIGLDVDIRLFDRNQGNISKARSIIVQNQYNLHAQFAQVRGEVSQAVEDYRIAHAALTTDDPERLKMAISVRDRIEAAYKAGGRPLIEVLDAQRAYRETLRTFTLDQSAYWHALHHLNATLGRQVLR